GEPKRTLKPDTDIATHDRAHRHKRQLVPSGGENRPGVIVAEQFVGDLFHVHQVLGISADPAENAEDRLDEEWRLDQSAVDKMREVVEVANIVAFMLEPRAALLAQPFDDLFDIAEGL